jgi:hypothetical protein
MEEIKATVYGRWTSYTYMKKNKTKKPLVIVSSGEGYGLQGRHNGGNVNNAQPKSNQNCQYESLPV